MSPIKVGLIGYGMSGRVFHAPLLNALPDFKITHVFSSREKEVALDLPDAKRVSSVDELISSDCDLVIVTSPNTEHFKHTHAALTANKHVVCEKPFVAKVDQIAELIELADRKKKVLSVFHNRRWDGDFIEMKKWVRDNRLGDWLSFESRFDRFRPSLPNLEQRRWRDRPLAMSGVFWDLGPHLIDQAIVLFGFPKEVQLQLLFHRAGAEVDDGFVLHLGYGKKNVILRASSVCSFADIRMQLDAQKGGFQILGMDGQEDALKTGAKTIVSQKARSFDGSSEMQLEVEPGSYSGFYLGVRDAILNGIDPPVTAHEAADVIQVIEYAIKSHQMGQRLPLREN